MTHLLKLLRYAALTLVTFVAVSWVIAPVISFVMERSGFRLAMAGSSVRFEGQAVHVVVGDSRLMQGFNAKQANKQSEATYVNLAYNGLESADLLAIVDTFVSSCRCDVKSVTVNAGALRDDESGVTDVQIFMASFHKALVDRVFASDQTRRWFVRMLPLLHYNNEVFHRSLFYFLRQQDDQDYSTSYSVRLTEGLAAELAEQPMTGARFHQQGLSDLSQMVRDAGAPLTLVVAPHHPMWTEYRGGFRTYVETVADAAASNNVRFFDHSTLLPESEDYSDIRHLNRSGQLKYTETIVATRPGA